MKMTRRSKLSFDLLSLEQRLLMHGTYYALSGGSFVQDWSNTSLITNANNWNNVSAIIGYQGNGLASAPGFDPQQVMGSTNDPFVRGSHTNPTTETAGVVEFQLTNPVVALKGTTGSAPYLQIHLNSLGRRNITVSYNLRDIEAGTDNAVQQVALQYRLSSVDPWINVPAGYVADATNGSTATKVTAVSATLPAAANDQITLQVRIITADAVGEDEYVGIDDINISSTGATFPRVSAAVFNRDASRMEMSFDFSRDVFSSLLLSDGADSSFVLTNLTTGTRIPASLLSMTSAAGDIVKLRYTGHVAGVLPNGNYRLTAIAANVRDSTGVPLTIDYPLDFNVLTGDLTGDRKVDTSDFNILAGNFGNANAVFSQGDLNYSGNIDSTDFVTLSAQYGEKLARPTPQFQAQYTLNDISAATFELDGEIGDYIQNVTNNWLLKAPGDNPAMIGMLASANTSPYSNLLPWSGEFAGKYLASVAQVLRSTPNAQLKTFGAQFVKQLIAAQQTDGYLGPFEPGNQLAVGTWTWDAWGHYWVMRGLLEWNHVTGDDNALKSAERIGDLLCSKYLATDARVFDMGNPTMNLAVVHSMALLYEQTGTLKYLKLAEQIVREFELPGSHDFVRAAADGKEFYQTNLPRWESLHALMGLSELYRLTGNDAYRQTIESMWWSIVKLDRHNNGGFSSGEQAQGDPYNTGAIETDATIAWIDLSKDMLRLTGSSIIADELENSTLNSVVGSTHPNGAISTYNTPMDGIRIASTVDIAFQIRPGSEQLNCCSVNAPRGFGLISDWALLKSGDGLALNYYGPSTFTAPAGGVNVKLTQTTSYPRDGEITLRVDPSATASFPLKLRIPHWSTQTQVQINGNAVAATPGTYLELNRQWQAGDTVTIKLDMSLRFWQGENASAGKTSVYRGPVLMSEETLQGDPLFSSQWQTFGSLRATPTAGATIDLTFQGDWVRWVGYYYDDAGMAKVSIDGQQVAIISQWANGRDIAHTWEWNNLGSGIHTIRIEALGQKQAESVGTWVNFVRFETPTPTFTAASLASAIATPVYGTDMIYTVLDSSGQPHILRDFGSAGWQGKSYRTWINVTGASGAAFSLSNPSRTSHTFT